MVNLNIWSGVARGSSAGECWQIALSQLSFILISIIIKCTLKSARQCFVPIDCEFISFFQAAGEMGIAVCNVPGYGVEEVYKKYQKNIKNYKKEWYRKIVIYILTPFI